MKKLVIGMVLLALLTGNAFAAQKIAFTKYPDLKLGFTTVVFTKCKMGPSVENAKAFIDYASEQGYAWIELRDANADLTVEQCKEIAAYAKSKNIEVGYATARGPLDPDFAPVLAKAIQNGAVFEAGPRTVRTSDANTEFAQENKKAAVTETAVKKVLETPDNPLKAAKETALQLVMEYDKDGKKISWTEAEFKQALETQNAAAKTVKAAGLQLMAENANLPLVGKFSLDEFLSAADPAVGYQLDTANMFAVARTKPEPKDAEAFLKKHISRLYYTHLKSSVNNQQNPVLADNPLPFETVFQLLAENKKPYIAIELGQVDSCDEQKANLQKSLDYLQSKGFITISQ